MQAPRQPSLKTRMIFAMLPPEMQREPIWLLLGLLVTKNADAKGRTRVFAVILHPRDAKQVSIPETKKE